MGCGQTKEREDTIIDIESCIETNREAETPSLSRNTIQNTLPITICDVPMNVDENSSSKSKTAEKPSPYKAKNDNNNNKRGKCKPMTAKKPPRPPKGLLSLDAADQKLIKEISQIAIIKRSRIERMNALRKLKSAKASSILASSSANLIALVFTVIFCILIIFQGISSGNRPSSPVEGSQESKGAGAGSIIVVQDQLNLESSTSGGVPLASAEPSSLVHLVCGTNNEDEAKKAVE